MAFIGEIGDLKKTSKELIVEWKILKFLSLSDEVDKYYHSPVFYFFDSRCCLRMYTNGETRNESVGWICLYVANLDSGFRAPVTARFSVKKPENLLKVLPFEIPKSTCGKGIPKFATRALMQQSLGPTDALVISCSLRCDNYSENEGTLSNRLRDLSQNLKTFRNEKKYSDYTVKVENHEFYCHRVILASRCPYFAKLFDSDVKENVTNEVEIEDIEASVFEIVLSYIYSGDVEGLSNQNVCKIYLAADRLLLGKLKRISTEFITTHIGLDIVCDVISTAALRSDEELEECALKYFAQHTDDVLGSLDWEVFKESCLNSKNPKFVFETLEKTLKKITRK